jgi:hypothetical protein
MAWLATFGPESGVALHAVALVDVHTLATGAPLAASDVPAMVHVSDPWLGGSTPEIVVVGPPPRDRAALVSRTQV